MHRPSATSRVLCLVAVLSLLLPATALASAPNAAGVPCLAAPNAATLAATSAERPGEPKADAGIATAAQTVALFDVPAVASFSTATPPIDPTEHLFLSTGPKPAMCPPSCPVDMHCCAGVPGNCCYDECVGCQ
jgi:hypothetical protein